MRPFYHSCLTSGSFILNTRFGPFFLEEDHRFPHDIRDAFMSRINNFLKNFPFFVTYSHGDYVVSGIFSHSPHFTLLYAFAKFYTDQ